MTNYNELLVANRRKLEKALGHLEYSYKKVQKLKVDVEVLDEEELETWESFAARFGRVADLFLTKYLRTAVLKNDPGFEGTLRDFVSQAEKLGFIENAETWMQIRELRNISAHDYTEEELTAFFKSLKKMAPTLLNIKKTLK